MYFKLKLIKNVSLIIYNQKRNFIKLLSKNLMFRV